MTIDEIKDLIRVVHETGIAELEYQRGDNRVRIRSAGIFPGEVTHNLPAAAPSLTSASLTSTPTGLEGKLHQMPTAADDEHNEIVKSPIVGTYYDSPAPGADPFVKVGDKVALKQVLCVIESMKLMNEIEAEAAGIVVAKHVENGRPVEYGESLFTIRPV